MNFKEKKPKILSSWTLICVDFNWEITFSERKKKEFSYFFIFHFSFSQFGINITQLTFDHNLITTSQKRYQLPFFSSSK